MSDKYFGSHEFQPRQETVKSSSERAFGVLFAAVFTLLGAFGFLGGPFRWLWFGLAVAFAVTAFVAPAALRPLNAVWTSFGLLLHALVSPLILAIMFYVFITPIGMLMRLTGKDPLRLRFDAGADSYWIARDKPDRTVDTFKHQF